MCGQQGDLSRWDGAAAGMAFWPHHRGDEIARCRRPSAAARRGAMALVAERGGAGGGFLQWGSRISRLTMARAGRPSEQVGQAVAVGARRRRAARCTALVLASGQADRRCRSAPGGAEGPRRQRCGRRRCRRRRSPAPAALPRAAAPAPGCRAEVRSALRNIPDGPPASRPWAITASTPRDSSQRASSTVVAELSTCAPAA